MSPPTVQLLYTLETTLILAMVTIGVFVSFRIVRFPDLSPEGGFGLSAVAGGMIMIATGSPLLGLLASVATGMCVGVVTALLANVVRLPTLLASILTMIMCFSTGLLVAGQPSQTLPDLWILESALFWIDTPLITGIVGGVIMLVATTGGLLLFLRTGAGFVLRARGENPNLARELGHSLVAWDVIALALANGVVGLAAGLFAQRAGYASINMGRGMAISALAAIMLAEAVFPSRTLMQAFLACFAGTLLMQLVRLLALNLGMPDGGLDLVTSTLIIVFCFLAKARGAAATNVLERIRM